MRSLACVVVMALVAIAVKAESWVRVNQMGYLPNDIKVAVMIMEQPETVKSFKVTNVATGKSVKIKKVKMMGEQYPFGGTARLDFSQITEPGTYYITAGSAKSREFKIGKNVYAGANEVPLRYMRQQRCGFNPFLKDSCHTVDGRIVLSGEDDGKYVDVTGGWHDASDYLQYLSTSANAVYQMLFAYSQNPSVWADEYLANGLPGKNNIPDILDEARWGLEWMLKMNPNDSTFFNQIADDRDHSFSGLPARDTVDYGWGPGKERPVYPCCGEPYGLSKYKNDSKGLASSVGKFCSSFSLGAKVFGEIDAEFAKVLQSKATNAYKVGKANPGACQTACTVSPYYYEEDNWSDDMELAAMEMYRATGEKDYLKDAIEYGRLEPVTPWMGADSAHHYQWYPFMNMGHVLLSMEKNERVKAEFLRNMKAGLERVRDRAGNSAFMHGIPFIWCSNNLTIAFITQAMLYRKLSGDTQYLEIETAMRDWLFGVNPWGKCMIIALPEDGDYPIDPHSPLAVKAECRLDGGVVDGPVYENIFKSLWYLYLRNEDLYKRFHTIAVYHDDYSDYSTNEPTMDGTACLTYFLGCLAAEAE